MLAVLLCILLKQIFAFAGCVILWNVLALAGVSAFAACLGAFFAELPVPDHAFLLYGFAADLDDIIVKQFFKACGYFLRRERHKA